jgi:hypothetical protein
LNHSVIEWDPDKLDKSKQPSLLPMIFKEPQTTRNSSYTHTKYDIKLPKYIKFTSNPKDVNVETVRQNIRLGKLQKHEFYAKLEQAEMKDILKKVYVPNRDTSFTMDLKVKPNHRYLGDQKVIQF